MTVHSTTVVRLQVIQHMCLQLEARKVFLRQLEVRQHFRQEITRRLPGPSTFYVTTTGQWIFSSVYVSMH